MTLEEWGDIGSIVAAAVAVLGAGASLLNRYKLFIKQNPFGTQAVSFIKATWLVFLALIALIIGGILDSIGLQANATFAFLAYAVLSATIFSSSKGPLSREHIFWHAVMPPVLFLYMYTRWKTGMIMTAIEKMQELAPTLPQ